MEGYCLCCIKLLLVGVIWLPILHGLHAAEVYEAKCRAALGMQNGRIPDEAVTSSSSYDHASVGPSNARIRTERNGGAWCPKNPVSGSSAEWLQVDLGALTRVTLVETQGRFGNGQGQEYAEHYKLQYRRTPASDWKTYTNKWGQSIFLGNKNTYIAELREVNPPIVARWIRFVPHNQLPRTVCMRVEVYGCLWKDGLVSYSIPRGERRGSEIDLYDFTYDGRLQDRRLYDGLGQLADGDLGPTNFRQDSQNTGKRGYEWVGWRNDSKNDPPIEIFITFDTTRIFNSVRLHCNNMFSKDVRVFRKAELQFSSVSGQWPAPPLVYEYMRDTLIEFARPVIIPVVPSRVGKFVKIKLYFDARWLLLSEMIFESVPFLENSTAAGSHAPPTLASRPVSDVTAPAASPVPPASQHEQLVGVVVGTVGAAVLLVAVVCGCVLRKSFWQRAQSDKVQVDYLQKPDVLDLPHATINGKLFQGNLYNAVTTQELEDQRGKSLFLSRSPAPGETDPYHIQLRQLPAPPRLSPRPVFAPDFQEPDLSGSADYAVPAELLQPSVWTQPPQYAGSDVTAMLPLELSDPVALTVASHRHPLCVEAPCGGSGAAPLDTAALLQSSARRQYDQGDVTVLQELGEGSFGPVLVCDLAQSDEVTGRTAGRTCRVALKMLRAGADTATRQEYEAHLLALSALKDANVCQVMGLCSYENALSVVLEYTEHSDLHQHLQGCTLNTASATLQRTRRKDNSLSHGFLVFFATQVASGMKYLESLNMVHRDLSARNCLVCDGYTIKICQLACLSPQYESDYYRSDSGSRLPLRWMAWESVLLGLFSTKSDVWAFAVTFWEILTLARDTPHSTLSDEDVIVNCSRCYLGDAEAVTLPQPDHCPKELFDLLLQCWSKEDHCRPTFKEIHMFLQRKNIGFTPLDSDPERKELSTQTLART